MNPQTNAAKPVGAVVAVIEHTKLSHVTFVSPVQFGGVSSNLRIGVNVDSIQPARFEADGSTVATEKGARSDGVLLCRTLHNRVSGRRETVRAFVPWANVGELGYCE